MSRLAVLQTFIGEIARPLAIISTSFSASWAVIEVAHRVENGNDGGLFIGAVFAGVGAIYIGKSVEVFKKSQAAADVEKARAKAGAEAPAPEPAEDPTLYGGPRP
ncbi:hypothetical protein [Phenylobacterium sp.]|uniref:hypothetical protein n=1 Tax=Phenylobacterium sp. TaxID=1871053 RepID=UPI00301E44A8